MLIACLLGTGSVGCGALLQDGTSVGNSAGRVLGSADDSPDSQGVGCEALGAPIDAAGDSNTDTAVLSMELNAAGAPTLAWSFGSAAAAQPVHVSTYDGAQWTGFAGSDTGAGVGSGNGGVGLVLDSHGRPATAWLNADQGAILLFKVWDGNAWTGLAGSETGIAKSGLGAERAEVRLALDDNDIPLLLWQQATTNGGVAMTIWDSNTWTDGPVFDVINSTGAPLAARPFLTPGTPGGDPAIVYSDSVSFSVAKTGVLTHIAFSGSPVATTNQGTRVAAAVKADGTVVFSWQGSYPAGSTNVFLASYSPVGTLDELGKSGEDGLSMPLQNGGGRNSSLALDAQGNPVVVWENPTTHRIMLRHFDGTHWVAPAGVLNAVNRPNTHGAWPVVRMAPNGQAVIAWHEDNAVVRVCSLPL